MKLSAKPLAGLRTQWASPSQLVNGRQELGRASMEAREASPVTGTLGGRRATMSQDGGVLPRKSAAKSGMDGRKMALGRALPQTAGRAEAMTTSQGEAGSRTAAERAAGMRTGPGRLLRSRDRTVIGLRSEPALASSTGTAWTTAL